MDKFLSVLRSVPQRPRTLINEAHRQLKRSVVSIPTHLPTGSVTSAGYTRYKMMQTPFYKVFLIQWPKTTTSGVHSHEKYACCMKVVQGTLKQTVYQRNEPIFEEHLRSGDMSPSEAGESFAHSIENDAQTPAWSLHVYFAPQE